MTHPSAAHRAPAHLTGLELLADAAVVVDATGQVSYVNLQAARLLRERPDVLIGHPADKVLRLRAENGLDWWQGCDPLHADATLLRRIAEQELTLQVGGTARPVALTGSRIAEGPDAGGLLLTLRRADARRRRDAARSDLVSTVSHELRSPLTSVKGFTKTLLAKWDRFTDEQKKQMLATVNEDADRVTRLLGELLAVSRIDAGRLQLKRQMIRLDRMIPAVVGRAEAGFGHGRRFEVDVPDLPELYADPDRIEQVLTNLIENAVKYTDGPIEIRAAEAEDHVRVAVADRGEGIEAEHVNAIFTKFFRRPGEKRQGTGLGLYITKGLVEAHGGEITVTSDPGGGSTFSFTVPKGGLELAGIDMEALRSSTIHAGDTAADAPPTRT
jgi:signal transduction histidine kinase